jgi:nitrite reductase/ring-hydroxylating ferredoxin subunit
MEEFAMADNGQNVIRVCAQADVPPGTVKAFAVGSNTLAVYNIDGAYYITDDECTSRPRASPTACSRAS